MQINVSIIDFVEDLRLLTSRSEIPLTELEELKKELRTNDFRDFINSVAAGSKPEAALRDKLLYTGSVLVKTLFGETYPEKRVNGFVDLISKDERGLKVLVEFKPLFKLEKDALKKVDLTSIINAQDVKEQVLRYLLSEESRFVILTNLEDVYCYSTKGHLSVNRLKPFYHSKFDEFLEEFPKIGDLWEFLERKESEIDKGDLDDRFLKSLDTWANLLLRVEFESDDSKRIVIHLINKLIFIQTLEDYGVINIHWLRKKWDSLREYLPKGEKHFVKRFLRWVDDFFYLYYDTELFQDGLIEKVKDTDENWKTFYESLQIVLGFAEWQEELGGDIRGVTQYNFSKIDEDILGRAYETYLAPEKKKEGIYYTRKHITKYMVDVAVGKVFGKLTREIIDALEEGDFDLAYEKIGEFLELKVLDPACGSGSFLIKAFRKIVEYYKQIIEKLHEVGSKFYRNIEFDSEKELKLIRIRELFDPDPRVFTSKILLRHIYGNDLDPNAVEVAKMNLWREVIIANPREFKYTKLPKDQQHVLPNLNMNITVGNSLVGLPDDVAKQILLKKYKQELHTLHQLRKEYLENPMDTSLVDKVEDIKNTLRENFLVEFQSYLFQKGLSEDVISDTKPLHWALEFWFVFFDENVDDIQDAGFDVIIGNPPHGADYTSNVRAFIRSSYELVRQSSDSAKVFVEKSIKMLKNGGVFSFVIPKPSTYSQAWEDFREFVLKYKILNIIDLGRAWDNVKHEQIVITLAKEPVDDIISTWEYQSGYATRDELLPVHRIRQEHVHPFGIIIGNIPPQDIPLGMKVLGKNMIQKSCIDVFRGYPRRLRSQSGIPCLSGVEVGRYCTENPSDCINVDESDSKLVRLQKPKVIAQRILAHITNPTDQILIKATADYDGKLTFETVSNIAPLCEERKANGKCPPDCGGLTPNYLCGLLNSKLIGWYVYRFIYNKAIRDMDFDAYFVKKIPIPTTPQDLINEIESSVSRIMNLVDLHRKILQCWQKWASNLKNAEMSLKDLLALDKKLMQNGRFHQCLTKNATFYPPNAPVVQEIESFITELKEPSIEWDDKAYKVNVCGVSGRNSRVTRSWKLNKSEYYQVKAELFGFSKFRVHADTSANKLEIYGIVDCEEVFMYEIEFSNKELMEHVYFAVVVALESKMRITTLSELLEKTKIPIIYSEDSGAAKSENIVKKVYEEASKLCEGAEPSIIQIDQEIRETDAKIDELVFKIYELNKQEIAQVLDALGVEESYRALIFSQVNL